MNIIELVKQIVESFPQISEICNSIHVDFTEDTPGNYGLSSIGDRLIKEDVLGNQTRQHSFNLFAVYQSNFDFERLANSGAILALQIWLERHALRQTITVECDGTTLSGKLTKLTCNNGMLYKIPNTINDGFVYQIQITATYTIES